MARRAHSLVALALLCAINLLNFADRYVVGGVQELIKHDRGLPGGARDATGALTDASLGLAGMVFVIAVVAMSPVAGWLGDRASRKYLVAGGVGLWSLATLGSAFAPTFGWLLAARAGIGLGEAGYAVVAPSLIADLFPPARRGLALGAFNVVIPLGAALGFGAGGAWGAAHGWRSAFLLAGVPGLALGLAYLLLPEPVRGAHDEAQPAALDLRATVRALVGNRALVLNVAGQVMLSVAIGGLGYWMPSFFVRALGMAQGAAGTWFGAMTAVAGLLGTIAGTFAGEAAQKRSPGGYLWVSGVTLAAAAPCVLLIARAPGTPLTLAATFAALFLLLVNTAPLYAALVNSVPATQRAAAMALNLVAMHLLGDAPAPPLLGAISDATGSLGSAVAATALPLLLGGALLIHAARPQTSGALVPKGSAG